MRVVVDTDVLLSGLRSATGASRLVLLAIHEGVITMLVSVAILLEYEAVLKRAKHLAAMAMSIADADEFLDNVALLAVPVGLGFSHCPSIRDPHDEIFVEAAINGRADALVTFNKNDHRPTGKRAIALGIAVRPPGELLRSMTWRPSETTFSLFQRT